MKKWYLSKTILVAMLMEALVQVTMHMEEVKSAISAHTNTDIGLTFAIVFPAVMVMMRFITTEPIKGVKNVSNNGYDQNVDDGGNGGGDRGDGDMDSVSHALSDSDTTKRESDSRGDDQDQRVADRDTKPRSRTKRRGCKKG